MKKSLIILYSVVLVLGIFESASAIPYTDFYNAGHLYMQGSLFGPKDSTSWTFDITDDGFNPVTQDATSASVQLNFQDDGIDFFEFAVLGVGSNVFVWEVDTGSTNFQLQSLMSLSMTGMVQATLIAIAGDFYFNSAMLSVEGTDPVTGNPATPTPEPATVLLLGMGLAGLVGMGAARRKKMKKNLSLLVNV